MKLHEIDVTRWIRREDWYPGLTCSVDDLGVNWVWYDPTEEVTDDELALNVLDIQADDWEYDDELTVDYPSTSDCAYNIHWVPEHVVTPIAEFDRDSHPTFILVTLANYGNTELYIRKDTVTEFELNEDNEDQVVLYLSTSEEDDDCYVINESIDYLLKYLK